MVSALKEEMAKEEMASLHLTLAELNEAIQSVMSASKLSTFEDGKYTDAN